MSEFLVIAPSEWTVIDWQYFTSVEPEIHIYSVTNWIATAQLSYIEEFLKKWELIGQDKSLVAAKLIDETFLIKVG